MRAPGSCSREAIWAPWSRREIPDSWPRLCAACSRMRSAARSFPGAGGSVWRGISTASVAWIPWRPCSGRSTSPQAIPSEKASAGRERSQEQSGRQVDEVLGDLDLFNPDLQKRRAPGKVQPLAQKQLQLHRRKHILQVDATESRDPHGKAVHHQLIPRSSSACRKNGVKHLIHRKRASLAAYSKGDLPFTKSQVLGVGESQGLPQQARTH